MAHFTENELKDEIERLGHMVIDILDIAGNLRSDIQGCSMKSLEKRGVYSYIFDIEDICKKYEELYKDVHDFVITPSLSENRMPEIKNYLIMENE